MAKMKKIIGLVLALTMVFSVSAVAMSASAFSLTGDNAGFSFDLSKLNPLNWFKSDDDTTTDAIVDSTNTEATTQRQPLIDFYFDYDVVKTLKWGISFGNVPTTTTEPVEEPTEPVTEEPTSEEPVSIVEETPLATAPVEITNATPLADVEQVANTGDAGIAVVVALSAVSAAAFVVAKKK